MIPLKRYALRSEPRASGTIRYIVALSALMVILGPLTEDMGTGLAALVQSHSFWTPFTVIVTFLIYFVFGMVSILPCGAACMYARRSTGKLRYGVLASSAVGFIAGLLGGILSLLIWVVAPQYWLEFAYAGKHPPDIVLSGTWAFLIYLVGYTFVGVMVGLLELYGNRKVARYERARLLASMSDVP